MNAKRVFFAVCLIVVSLLSGCSTKAQSVVIPVTGKAASDAAIASSLHTCEQVLDFIDMKSDTLASHPQIPAMDQWILTIQPDTRDGVPPQFKYTSGDWVMIVRQSASDSNKYVVAVTNAAEGYYWCGYKNADGNIIDASLITTRAGKAR